LLTISISGVWNQVFQVVKNVNIRVIYIAKSVDNNKKYLGKSVETGKKYLGKSVGILFLFPYRDNRFL
jgi:hypothetical protein